MSESSSPLNIAFGHARPGPFPPTSNRLSRKVASAGGKPSRRHVAGVVTFALELLSGGGDIVDRLVPAQHTVPGIPGHPGII